MNIYRKVRALAIFENTFVKNSPKMIDTWI